MTTLSKFVQSPIVTAWVFLGAPATYLLVSTVLLTKIPNILAGLQIILAAVSLVLTGFAFQILGPPDLLESDRTRAMIYLLLLFALSPVIPLLLLVALVR